MQRFATTAAPATQPRANTVLAAIHFVMAASSRAMSPQQIHDAIVAQGLYEFRAAEPVHVVRSQLRRHCVQLDFPSASDTKYFAEAEKNRYALLAQPLQQRPRMGNVGLAMGPAGSKRESPSPLPSQAFTAPRTQVFISYAHEDSRWLKRLQVQLKPLVRDGVISLWDDTRIKAGDAWRREITAAISRARIAILLVSADFIASDFIDADELPPLLSAAQDDHVRILMLIVSPCRFERNTALSKFQALNAPSRPMSVLDRTQREALFVKVADAVESALYPA